MLLFWNMKIKGRYLRKVIPKTLITSCGIYTIKVLSVLRGQLKTITFVSTGDVENRWVMKRLDPRVGVTFTADLMTWARTKHNTSLIIDPNTDLATPVGHAHDVRTAHVRKLRLVLNCRELFSCTQCYCFENVCICLWRNKLLLSPIPADLSHYF